MIIRSATFGVDWRERDRHPVEARLRAAVQVARDRFGAAGHSLRTCRLTLTPVELDTVSQAGVKSLAEWVAQELAPGAGLRWFSLPLSTFYTGKKENVAQVAVNLVQRFPSLFLNLVVARDGEIHRDGIVRAAEAIKSISRLSANGFDNFRVGASCNGRPNTPFFPFTYHQGPHAFSLALELPAHFISILQERPRSLEEFREAVLERLAPQLAELEGVARSVEADTGFAYRGIDLSLAPSFGEETSVGRILELLGGERFGTQGTLFLTGYLTDLLRQLLARSGVRAAGFNGVMYSLLEDATIAEANNRRTFTLDSLVAYSAVCGCGLDMVPLPGDVFAEEIALLILDVATLSTVLGKPLGLRVLPIPHKEANEFTEFSHDFLHNTRVQAMPNRVGSLGAAGRGVFEFRAPLHAAAGEPAP